MKVYMVLALVGLLVVVNVSSEESHREKRGWAGITKWALKRLARSLGNPAFRSRVVRLLRQYGGNGAANMVDDMGSLLYNVANKLDYVDRVTCALFQNAAVQIGLPSSFGHAVCQVVLILV